MIQFPSPQPETNATARPHVQDAVPVTVQEPSRTLDHGGEIVPVASVAVAPVAAQPPAPQGRIPANATMMGVASPDVAMALAQAQARAAQTATSTPAVVDAPRTTPSPGVVPPGGAGGKTMLGVMSPMPAGQAARPAPIIGASPGATLLQAPPAPGIPATAPEVAALRARTMLGVAMPGIAPTHEAPRPLDTTLASPVGGAPAAPARAGSTMLGVAIPGVAPLAAGVAPPPQAPLEVPAVKRPIRSKLANTAVAEMPVLPAPAPYIDDVRMPQAPRKRAAGGVSITLVAAIIGGLVLVGGVAIALFYRGAPPLAAKPQLDAQGNEVLHLQCENCADGTVVSLDGAKGTFKGKAADLPLGKPLSVGENDLTVTLDRPGAGRDETVKLAVPVAFRIRADLSDINAKTPVIAVRVAAAPGSEVSVDKKPLTLDASGNGSYVIDVSSDTEGVTEDQRIIDRKIDYSILSATGAKGAAPDVGQVSARIAVVPLRLDAPSAHAVTEGASVTIAGQTVAGGAVTIDGAPTAMQPDGSFVATRDVTSAAAAPMSIEIRASAQGRAPRTAHVTVRKVASLDAEAKAAEQTPLLTYDQISPDIAAKVGQRAVVAGEVLDARVSGHETIALVNDTRGCKSGPCLARVIAAEDARIARGDSVRAYGEVTRVVTTSAGKTIPELQADFVAHGKK